MTIKSKDLAKLLGVSTATVSLVINNKPGISNQLREKLTEQIRSMGYEEMLQIGVSGSDIRQSGDHKKHTIVYAIFSNENTANDFNSFYPPVLEGAEIQARDEGYNIQVVHVDSYCKCGLKGCINVDDCVGIIVQAKEITDEVYDECIKTGLPFVSADNYSYARNLSSVCVNNQDGIFFAVRLLHSLGHKNIGFIASGSTSNSIIDRRRCFHEALREFNLPDREEFRLFIDNSKNLGYKELVAKCKKLDKLPTAFICENDIYASMTIKAFRTMGIKVPGDISVIGFDDRSVAQWADPPITTLRVHRHLMGRQLVTLLLNVIRMRKVGFKALPYKMNIGVELVERESTAKAKSEFYKF